MSVWDLQQWWCDGGETDSQSWCTTTAVHAVTVHFIKQNVQSTLMANEPVTWQCILDMIKMTCMTDD